MTDFPPDEISPTKAIQVAISDYTQEHNSLIADSKKVIGTRDWGVPAIQKRKRIQELQAIISGLGEALLIVAGAKKSSE